MNLNWTNPVGQQWIFAVQNGDSYIATSSSPYLLFELTNDNLVIMARKEAPNGAHVDLNCNGITVTYTLNKNFSEETVSGTTFYYGNSSGVPTVVTNGNTFTATGNTAEITFYANNRYAWVAAPSGWNLIGWIETTLGTDFLNPNQIQNTIVGGYNVYYFQGVVNIDNNLKVTFNKQ